MRKNHLKRLCVAALCLALAAILPRLFHLLPGGLGRILSPIHIPVLLAGLACGWYYGAICGGLAPLISYLISGMPVAAKLPSMIAECLIYGLVSGLLICLIKTKRKTVNLYISLILAMLIGRVAYALINFYIFGSETSPIIWLMGTFMEKLPGTVLHLVFVPLLYLVLYKTKLIPRKQ
ncbi:MAG: ECF transporter S component [Clostridia bacterium]|nr:ECF transporter S component [Clostridia bacterium]